MQAALIEEVVGQFVVLKKSGSAYKGLSPFSSEKTPSFFVVPAKGIFKDFSSGKGGNVVNFLMEHEKMTYPESLRWLAAKYGIEIEESEQKSEKEDHTQREALSVVNEFARKFFTDQMRLTDEGRSVGLGYLRQRGFRDDIIERFQCGYCPEGWDTFTQTALRAGHQKELLLQAGLSKERDGNLYDFFRGRVIFPIHNVSGKVIAFGGRILRSDAKAPKYVNSPETELYVKSRTLYGLAQAKNAIVKLENCYLAEGYTDVMALHQAGVENAVASAGTSLTEDQIRVIKRYTNTITVLYDGDSAGIRASFRGIEMILAQGMNVKSVLFPDGEDPDSYARKTGSEEFQRFLTENAKDFIVFKSDLLLAEAQGDPIKRADLIRDIVRTISVVPNQIQRAVYVQQCARLLDMDEAILTAEANRIIIERSKANRPAMAGPATEPLPEPSAPDDSIAATVQPDFPEEIELLRLIVNYGKVKTTVEIMDGEGNVQENDFALAEVLSYQLLTMGIQLRHEKVKKVLEFYRVCLANMRFPEDRELANHPDPEVSALVAGVDNSLHELDPKWESKHNIFTETENMVPKRLVEDIMTRIQKIHIEEEQKEVLAEMTVEGTPDEEVDALQSRYKSLQDRKKVVNRQFGTVILPR